MEWRKIMAKKNGCGYWRGLVTGLMIGAGTALLLAQKKSGNGDSDVVEGIGKLKEKVTDIGSGAVEAIGDKLAGAKDKITSLRATDDDNVEELVATDENQSNDADDALADTVDDAETVAEEIGDNLDDETSKIEEKDEKN
jgi:gas vesicle protein